MQQLIIIIFLKNFFAIINHEQYRKYDDSTPIFNSFYDLESFLERIGSLESRHQKTTYLVCSFNGSQHFRPFGNHLYFLPPPLGYRQW